jgi:hypothetical protein
LLSFNISARVCPHFVRILPFTGGSKVNPRQIAPNRDQLRFFSNISSVESNLYRFPPAGQDFPIQGVSEKIKIFVAVVSSSPLIRLIKGIQYVDGARRELTTANGPRMEQTIVYEVHSIMAHKP